MNKCKLGDIADIITGPFGSQLHMKDYVKEGVPVIMPQNITDRSYNEDDIAKVTIDDYNRLIRYSTQKNDIIFARRGDVEKHAFITNNTLALCGTGCLRVRITSPYVYPLYVSFYLTRPETKYWLTLHAVGSNMPNLNTDILSNVPIELPEITAQIKIADSLQLLDSKIEDNNKINTELESLAKAIYDYWFLQFEFPNEEGKPYKSFGGKMVWNEELKREIPEIGHVSTMGQLIKENPKSVIQVGEAKTMEGFIPFFTSGDAILNADIAIVDGRNCYLNTGGNADIKFYVGEASYSTDTWCITADNMIDYLYLMLEKIDGQFEQKYFQGTGLKHLQKPLFKKMAVYVPDSRILLKFNKFIQPVFDMISANTRQNQQLTSLRDFLLPLLMNGQVGFKDNEVTV